MKFDGNLQHALVSLAPVHAFTFCDSVVAQASQ